MVPPMNKSEALLNTIASASADGTPSTNKRDNSRTSSKSNNANAVGEKRSNRQQKQQVDKNRSKNDNSGTESTGSSGEGRSSQYKSRTGNQTLSVRRNDHGDLFQVYKPSRRLNQWSFR